MPVILETISQILKYVNVGVDELNVRYGMRFVYSEGIVLKGSQTNFSVVLIPITTRKVQFLSP